MSAEENGVEYPVDVDLGDNGGRVRFKTPSQALRWAKKEKEFWGWADEYEPSTNNPEIPDIRNRLVGAYSDLVMFAEEWVEDPSHGAATINIASVLSRYQREDTGSLCILQSGTPEAAAIETIKNELGEDSALAALGLATDQNLTLKEIEVIEGVFLYVAMSAGFSSKTVAAQRRSLKNLHTDMKETLTENVSEIDEFKEQLSNLVDTQITATDAAPALLKRLMRSVYDQVNEEWVELKESYDTSFSLFEPRRYWSEKRTKHKNFAIGFGIVLFAYIGGAIVAGFLLYDDLGPVDFSSLKDWNLGPVGLIALGVGVVFAIARIFHRLFVSQLHLYNDADERVTMLETYLALNRKGHTQPEWLPVLYARLFAPASDGVVKDEIASPSVTEYAMKTGERIAGR